MREDPGADVLLLGITIFTAIVSLYVSFRPGADNHTWEPRWRALDPGYRDWLAAMTTSHTWMKALADPEEIELARGFACREHRRAAYFDLAAAALLAFGLALVLMGALPTSTVTSGLLFFGAIHGLTTMLRQLQLRRRLPGPTDPDVAPPSPRSQQAHDLIDGRSGAVA